MAIESAPKPSVETVGVRKRLWTRDSRFVTAFQCAIDSVVRAVGRIVVCVEAEAEVSTAITSSLFTVLPSTPEPSAFRTSSWLASLVRKPTPWKDWAPAVTTT